MNAYNITNQLKHKFTWGTLYNKLDNFFVSLKIQDKYEYLKMISFKLSPTDVDYAIYDDTLLIKIDNRQYTIILEDTNNKVNNMTLTTLLSPKAITFDLNSLDTNIELSDLLLTIQNEVEKFLKEEFNTLLTHKFLTNKNELYHLTAQFEIEDLYLEQPIVSDITGFLNYVNPNATTLYLPHDIVLKDDIESLIKYIHMRLSCTKNIIIDHTIKNTKGEDLSVYCSNNFAYHFIVTNEELIVVFGNRHYSISQDTESNNEKFNKEERITLPFKCFTIPIDLNKYTDMNKFVEALRIIELYFNQEIIYDVNSFTHIEF